MPITKFLLPKMGESITEATIIKWAKMPGDIIALDEDLVEIATDKVDSDLPSPFEGKIVELLVKEGDVVPVGAAIALIETEKEYHSDEAPQMSKSDVLVSNEITQGVPESRPTSNNTQEDPYLERALRPSNSSRFYSPLIRNIARIEGISVDELDRIPGSGAEGRLTKSDIEVYLQHRDMPRNDSIQYQRPPYKADDSYPVTITGDADIIEMDRTRKLIADHMVRSKRISPHVTSFLEIDVTDIVKWRTNIKNSFKEKYNQKITFTPIFIEAVKDAILDFPKINASVDGDKIVVKKYINIGMATAMSDDLLIVPVIKGVEHLSLLQIVQSVNDLAFRARNGKLKPEDVMDGTFTLTNVGSFGNTQGVPIINQPQVAILSTGAIRKKPAVIQVDGKDEIAIRSMMFLSLSYDHRIVDGALGGRFLRRVGDYLEKFDVHTSFS